MLRQYISRHKEWSLETFGEGMKTEGICRHIEEELNEIRETPNDLMEWVDVIILAIDGAWRAGFSPVQIINGMVKKQSINFERKWNKVEDDEPTKHIEE